MINEVINYFIFSDNKYIVILAISIIFSTLIICFSAVRKNFVFTLLTICLSILLIVYSNHLLWSNSTRIIVKMPSVSNMSYYINEFSDKYIDTSVPFYEHNEFIWNLSDDNLSDSDIFLNFNSINVFKKKLISYSEIESPDDKEYISREEKNPLYIFQDQFYEKILYFILVILTATFFILLSNYSLFPRYCKITGQKIAEYSHLWMGNNTLEDILISINVLNQKNIKKTDLCMFVREKIFLDQCGIYFLIGQAGEGKSVALMKIALMLIKERTFKHFQRNRLFFKIPVILSIPQINFTCGKNLEEQIYDKIIQVYNEKIPSFIVEKVYDRFKNAFNTYLKKGSVFVLLDGYDEINENQRNMFINMLDNMSKNYNKCFYFISSRTYVFNNDNYRIFKRSTPLYLTSLGPEQIYDFIFKWNFTKEKAKELYHQIIGNIQMTHLASNALLLTLICYLFNLDETINPKSISDFYANATVILLSLWEEDKDIQKRTITNSEVKQDALAAIAYYQLIHAQPWSTTQEIVQALEYISKNNGLTPIAVIDDISLQTGMLEINAQKEYHFYHRSFQEFYAALYMVKNNLDIKAFEKEIEQYYNLIVFYLSLKSDEFITQKILMRNKNNHNFVLYVLLHCEITDKKIVQNYINEYILFLKPDMDLALFKELGELARTYTYVRTIISNKMRHLYKHFDTSVKKKCFVALSYFEDSIQLAQMLKKDFKINDVAELLTISDDTIDHVIYHIPESQVDIEYLNKIIELIGGMKKYDLLLRMMVGCENPKIKEIIMGVFIHMTTDIVFLEWLDTKDFLNYENESEEKIIKEYIDKYKWYKNNISTSIIENFYVLVRYALKLLDKNYAFQLGKIDNGIKFIVTYIKNEETTGSAKNYLIDIPDFKINSIVEFEYHWKKAHKKKLSTLGRNPEVLKNIFVITLIMTNIFLMCYYLKNTAPYIYYLNKQSRLSSLIGKYFVTDPAVFKAWDIVNIRISKYIKYNGFYFLFSLTLNIMQRILNIFLCNYDFTNKSFSHHMLFASVSLMCYFFIVQDLIFRITFALLTLLIMVVNIIQHKNNYPSFRQPQFKYIRDFLHR